MVNTNKEYNETIDRILELIEAEGEKNEYTMLEAIGILELTKQEIIEGTKGEE